ncbi:sensor histidine kinase [Maridesulfovibrio hydrothermalis]|uniref:histidine kinase n=1 Tax=Maridesulfovibrio hydrothermalis AM13 = DSM 14728 TaxID=1121451 RepID=L0RA67_9BACT|nr:ATP-binding protein [Maridesulfovibrio hydrothermalis]CCO23085.1 Histidine kinase [Maridesulfovibrio hydrothermalis AM13 = DSM 14728]
MDQNNQDAQIKSFQLVKLLSWTLLVVIIASSLGLSVFLAKHADETLLEKQKEFALLQAENLNHQIYRRFILPTIIGYGSIGLKNKEQMDRLDQVVRSTVHSFKVNEVRIYDPSLIISYSTDAEMIGRDNLGGEFIKKVLDSGEPKYEFISKKSTLGMIFDFNMRPGTMQLKIVYPLRSEKSLKIEENVIMGVMVLTQDITEDYQSVINFERLILFTSSFAALILFATIMAIIRRADIINAQRMKERQAFERELNQSEKLASIGRMVSGVAHEIRNPLGIIQSSSELLLKRMNDNDPVNTKILGAIYEECKRLSRTVSDFLDYARPRKISLVAIDPADLLDKIYMFLESSCKGDNIELVRNYTRGHKVCGDEDLLYRAFYNLIGNAMQAVKSEGKIFISLDAVENGLNVIISDTGKGFSPEIIDKVKDPFFTTKDSGTGLGLAIVSNIVESHNGKFTIGNNPEGGARITIFLPEKKDC